MTPAAHARALRALTSALGEALRGGDSAALADAAEEQARGFAALSGADVAPADRAALGDAIGAVLREARAELADLAAELRRAGDARRRLGDARADAEPRFLSRRA